MTSEFQANTPRFESIELDIDSGRLAEAALALNALQRETPDDPRIFASGTRLGLIAGNAGAALASAERAVQLAPKWPHALALLARAQAVNARHEAAIDTSQTLLDQTQGTAFAFDTVAFLGMRAFPSAKLIALLRRGVAAFPSSDIYAIALARAVTAQDAKEAADLYAQVAERSPSNTVALTELAAIEIARANNASALRAIEKVVALGVDNASVRFLRDRAEGKAMGPIPAEQIADLFDRYAEQFDDSLTKSLAYRAPWIAARYVTDAFPDKNISVLDLGCGTGLFGAALGPIGEGLVGVDLSRQMIEKALQRKIYSRLHHSEMIESLTATASEEFDVVAAIDVAPYLGRLESFVSQATRVMKAQGMLLFTCERAAETESDVTLRSSDRYAHRASYLMALCEECGLANIVVDPFISRTEAGRPVESYLVAARKFE